MSSSEQKTMTRRGAVALVASMMLASAGVFPRQEAWASTISAQYPAYGVNDWSWFVGNLDQAVNYSEYVAGTAICAVGANLGHDGGSLRVNHFAVSFKSGWCVDHPGTVIACPPDFIRQCAEGQTGGVTDDEQLPDSFICIDWSASTPSGTYRYLVWYVAAIGSYRYYLVIVNSARVGGAQRLAAMWRVTDAKTVKERVACDFDGGTFEGASSWVSESAVAGAQAKLPHPQRRGYVFTGWKVESRTVGSAGMVMGEDDAVASLPDWGLSHLAVTPGQLTPNIKAMSIQLEGAAAGYANGKGGGICYQFTLESYGLSLEARDGEELSVHATQDGEYYGPVIGLWADVEGAVAQEYGVCYRLRPTDDSLWTGWFANGVPCVLPQDQPVCDAHAVVVPRDTDIVSSFGEQRWRFRPLTSLAQNSVAQANLKATWEIIYMNVNYYLNGELRHTNRLPQGAFVPVSVASVWMEAGRPGAKAPSGWHWDSECVDPVDASSPVITWYEKELNLYAITLDEQRKVTVRFAWTNQALSLINAGKVCWKTESGEEVMASGDECLPDEETFEVPPAVVWGEARQPRFHPWSAGYGALASGEFVSNNYRDSAGSLLLDKLDVISDSCTLYLSLEPRAFDAERTFA